MRSVPWGVGTMLLSAVGRADPMSPKSPGTRGSLGFFWIPKSGHCGNFVKFFLVKLSSPMLGYSTHPVKVLWWEF